jgi:hypothetical protein
MKLTDRIARWAHNSSGTRETHTMANPVAGGDTDMTPRSHGEASRSGVHDVELTPPY